MVAIIVMGIAAAVTVGCIIFTIWFAITTFVDTVEFRRSLDSNFLLSDKEAQTRLEFKSYNKTPKEEF